MDVMTGAPLTHFHSIYEALTEESSKEHTSSHLFDNHSRRIPACFEHLLGLPDDASLKRSLEIVSESIPQDSPHHAVAYLSVCEMALKKAITKDGVVDNSTESIRNLLVLMRLALQECSTGLVAKKGLEYLQIIETLLESQSFDSLGIETGELLTDILFRIRVSDWSQPLVQRCIQGMVTCSVVSGAKVRKKMITLLRSLYGGEKGAIAVHTSSTVAFLNQTLKSSNHSYVYRSLQLMQVILPFFSRKDILQLLEKLFLFENEDAILWQLNYAVVSSVLRIDYERSKTAENEAQMNLLMGKRRLVDSDIHELYNYLLQKGCPSQKMGLSVILGYVWSLCFGMGCLEIVPNISLVCSVIQKLLDSLEVSVWLETAAPYRISQVIVRFIVILGEKFPFVLASSSICSIFCQLTNVRFSSIFMYACEILNELLTTLLMHSKNSHSSSESKEADSIIQILNHLVTIRNHLEYQQKDNTSLQQVHHILQCCLKCGGAKYLLRMIPLCQNVDDIHHMWLFDMVCKYTRQSSLQLFYVHILPLYKLFAEKVYQATQKGLEVEAKNWRMYQLSVWNAFASFCREPDDINDGLIQLREPLMEVFKGKDSDAQMEIVRGFRNLCQSVADAQTYSPILSNAMKEILPVLFRISFECPVEKRNLVLETVTLGAKVCSSQSIIADYLRKIMKRLIDSVATNTDSNEDNKGANHQSIWLQLATALMESHVLPLDTPEMQLLQKTLLSNLAESHDGFLQKKSYRALLDMLKLENGEVTAPILEQVTGSPNIWYLFQKLVTVQNSVTAGARALRIASMSVCLKKLIVEQFKEALPQVLTEWILSTRDQSAKARNAAFQAILDAISRYRNTYSVGNLNNLAEQEQLGLQEIFSKVIAGLAGKSTTMLAATMDTIGRILFEYRGELQYNTHLKQMILQLFIISTGPASASSNEEANYPGPVTLLLQHPSNEVVRSALNLVKVLVTILRDENDLLVVADAIMSRLMDVSFDSKEDLRRRVKVILERLLRRCEVTKIESIVPKEHQPLFHHVRKTWERNKRKKRQNRENKEPSTWDEALQDDDTHSAEDAKADRRINEEEEPLDILSAMTQGHGRSLMKRKKMEMRDSKRDKDAVRYTETGRIIIKEEEEEEKKDRNLVNVERAHHVENSKLKSSLSRSIGQKRIGQAMVDKQKRHKKSKEIETGARFRSSKAQGDIQRPGMPQPFAYIPLHLGYSHGKMGGKSKEKKNAWRQSRKKSLIRT
ncbi:uncharacterized protein Gasu_43320 [Galdieria sulphuraria]|uniref:RRP12 HEAT domain-containing protein n=1 Tax=Galdieria sulphuraria TaxID=130081 RepID=M2VXZ0_GALSU|nr:uncharacterized protein Gasu_43320 [Galdieria sulphuraria]EME28166.1 hypothetical protein Gasu_43320 [Galdieria sulphuraria]|eukprot:XP_005704686.1 hypothetical protein Gasu_43320 [Galdieria sulphuraria]